MVSITLSVPLDLKRDMDNFSDINWSAVAREAIRKKILMLEKFKDFTKNSEFNEEDALNFGRKVSFKVANKHKIK
jgi:hypothetical protein